MSEYGWRFMDREQQGVTETYGYINASPWTKIRCPVCGAILWIPQGHHDTTHECTLMCPYCSQQMQPIPPEPSKTTVRIVPQTAPEFVERFRWYFYYCANPQCWFYQNNGVAYMSRKVVVDILVGR